MRDGARRGRRRTIVAALALALVALTAGPGPAAEDVTEARLRELASRADRDPVARQELLQVRRVDGRPVDIGTALAGASAEEQRARLRTLASGSSASPGPDTATARDDARRILESRRFKPAQTPRPLRGILRRIGEWLRPIVRPFARAWEIATGPGWAWQVIGGTVLVVGALVAVLLVRRRTQAALAGDGRSGRARRQSPEDVERQAAAAEAEGDFDTALRLRFQAGLLRLDAAGAVKLRPSLTTGELTRRVRSNELRDLAAAFEAVAYAGEHADEADIEAARRQWPRVLEEAGRR
jgi:hypothetical protein